MSAAIEETEVLIVGAGAAGTLVAAKLAEAGRKVVVLEAGAPWRVEDMVSSQLWARRLKGTPGVTSVGGNPVSAAFNTGAGFGGSAIHYYASSIRLQPEDFKVRSIYGRSADWPFDYDALRPYYDKVQREIGISGDAAAEKWRPEGEPYPMPPLLQQTQADVITRGFQAKGLALSPTPTAINSEEYNGRGACLYDGWCDAGCPIGALANPLVTHMPPAIKAGAEFRPWSTVVRVNTDASGAKVTGVTYADKDGVRHEVRAQVVVIAALALQAPRLLLASATDKHPRGLANSSDAVGRYLMSLPIAYTYGLFDEPTDPFMGVNGGNVMCQDHYLGKKREAYFGSTTWLIGQSLKPNDLVSIANARSDLFGDPLHAFIKKASHHLGGILLVGEDQPDADNRIMLTEDKDRFGVPVARAIHTFGPDPTTLHKTQMVEAAEIMRAAGATEVWHGPLSTLGLYGTTRMGNDPATSVTNGYGQAHDIPNLFIAGSSLFPTTGAVAPTFTLLATSYRTADFIAEKWGSFG